MPFMFMLNKFITDLLKFFLLSSSVFVSLLFCGFCRHSSELKKLLLALQAFVLSFFNNGIDDGFIRCRVTL